MTYSRLYRLLGWVGVWCYWREGHYYIFKPSVRIPYVIRPGNLYLCKPHFWAGMENWERAAKEGK